MGQMCMTDAGKSTRSQNIFYITSYYYATSNFKLILKFCKFKTNKKIKNKLKLALGGIRDSTFLLEINIVYIYVHAYIH